MTGPLKNPSRLEVTLHRVGALIRAWARTLRDLCTHCLGEYHEPVHLLDGKRFADDVLIVALIANLPDGGSPLVSS